MERLALVCAAGAVGTGLRYGLSLLALRLFGPAFPWGTLAVNVLGCAAMGLVMHLGTDESTLSPTLRLTLATGLLGGLTTYSAFNHETIALLEKREPALALVNFATTTLACGAAGLFGLWLGRRITGG